VQKDLEFLTFIFALSYDDSLYEKFENSISSLFQLLKIEAIQISLFIDVLVIVFVQNFSTSKLKSIFK